MGESKKKESGFSIILFIGIVFSSLISIIITLFSGATNDYQWLGGAFFLIALIFTYITLRKSFYNIGFLLSLIFMGFWLIPTTEFLLYESNSKNYRISEEFKKTESLLAAEKSKGCLSIEDLNKILIVMRKLQSEGFKKNRPSGTSRESIAGLLNIYAFDSIFIPELIKISYTGKFSAGSMKKYEICLQKGDSLKTILFVKTDFPRPSDYEIIRCVEWELKEQTLLLDLKTGMTHIPYSEFLIDGITAFSNGDISPARNFPKLLNGLQALIMIFLSTMIINSVGLVLTVSQKKETEPLDKTMD